jgi:pimeloyl-ACP methyl ester carboxylesterase
VFQAIEREHIPSPVLIGHSMAGGEMTLVGHDHSDRLGGIVYLDAVGDKEDDPPADKQWAEAFAKLPPGLPPPPPTCAPDDRSSFAAYRQSWGCHLGFVFPESELHQIFEQGVGGSVGPAKTPGWVRQAIDQGTPFRRDYSNIRVPVLALIRGFAPEATTDEVLNVFHYSPRTAADRAAIDRFMAANAVMVGRWIDKLKHGAPDARIVYYPTAGHYVYMTNEADVLREIHAFIAKSATSK